MKNNVFLLYKILFVEQFKINDLKTKGYSKNKGRLYLMIGIVGVLSISLMIYAYMMGVSLSMMGLNSILPAYALVVSSFILFFITILKSNGMLFAFKDYEMLMSYPVKTSTIIFSRFLMMYILNFSLAFVVMLPMGIAYAQYNPVSAGFYFIWFVGILVTPLFPTTIAAIIGAVIVWGASKFRYSNILVTVFSMLLLIGILLSSVFAGKIDQSALSIDDMANVGMKIGDMINELYPLATLFAKAVNESDVLALGIFVTFSIIWFLVFLALLSFQYKKMNTAMLTHRRVSNYQLSNLGKNSPLQALYKKEFKRFFSSTVYVINVGVGVIMAFVFSISALFMPNDLILEIFPLENVDKLIETLIPFFICGIIGMSCTAAVSLSLEGKNIWILQSLPLHPKTIFCSKMLVNLTLLIPTALMSSILLSIRFASSLKSVILIVGIPLIYCFFVPAWGMFIDIKMGRYDWVSETAIIKQSANAIIGLLGSGIIGLLPIVFVLIFNQINVMIIVMTAIVLFIGASIFLYKTISKAVI